MIKTSNLLVYKLEPSEESLRTISRVTSLDIAVHPFKARTHEYSDGTKFHIVGFPTDDISYAVINRDASMIILTEDLYLDSVVHYLLNSELKGKRFVVPTFFDRIYPIRGWGVMYTYVSKFNPKSIRIFGANNNEISFVNGFIDTNFPNSELITGLNGN